ncbi:SDR family NAD(P)-dependent oxidoreductase [Nonomuraea diastatica]|uniref:SDR family NAD(P)-dependent oxidoreductase n=2 Tax=Nonomuraea diastatica TaxID=1848329 RepID=A0A4R4WVC3_9ACTN|nr:SDR family NAD(P)-dependent oxidoreductase [Nonomuraea diastatica]
MLSRGEPSHIVNTASVAGLGVFPGRSASYGYTASKAAVIALTETLHHGLRDERRPDRGERAPPRSGGHRRHDQQPGSGA